MSKIVGEKKKRKTKDLDSAYEKRGTMLMDSIMAQTIEEDESGNETSFGSDSDIESEEEKIDESLP